MRSHLLNDATAQSYRRSVTEGVERVAEKLAATRGPFTGVTPADLAPAIEAVDLDRPLGDSSAALDELESVYLRDAVYFHHPRYLAHLNCPVVIPAVLGEAVLSAVNSSLDTWDQSAGGTLIERKLIDWTNGRIGFGPAADGVFTSGGSQSNLQALLLAREEAKADALSKLRIFSSECSHFSVQKSAKLLGLGQDAVVSIPVDRNKRMQSVVLAAELAACRAEGLVPMAIVATAGTTDFGSIDPLPEIAALADEYGAWMHVDAAYGCGLLASRTRRHLLDGIERADSVTVDFHKSFFQPVSSSAILVRDGATLRHATYHADYLNPLRTVAEQIPNQVDKSLQTTRRFDALKLWMTLRVMGADGIGELFDEVCDLAAEGFDLLAADPRYDVVVAPQLSTLVYRYIPAGAASPEEIDRANLHARKALFASGEAVVAGTKVDGRQYLKFTLLNPETTAADIAAVLDLIAGHAEQYLGETLVHA
ncbi:MULTISPECIES: pyridoxal phosphate-dependent decarboxylase family protein [Streptomyces]|uniref:Desferrioxamine E biosynthesis protein DesA L-2,4-diaminobutyrate decarboxylase n=1 Tax=Streptomyces venezuelae (strain ATCC 10712 / CBS 650.69 / DSM 40230 / JCM 4526 / NBRC 13096 / PD 04745) TaxID=953739 RepID=F2R3L4_STRVP|nr:aspartate aminotransferase family protein [Streptomyces venezuelae]APE21776.1 pyridoxal-dependent decarboxylase [Streptomyces venezuelae]QER99162.1 aminotransferase class V-fold PLP-dependent enzyme [Streptomyces venezuelae ATCC 10712]CCA55856.1 Desferrioxamine E biosynthesis protein DesA; L-2,4-diaminobutyrate decarboxylase [Streptomyces venezuelae ATCC 10712]